MNATIIDPLQGDFPEVIEEYLEHGGGGITKCISFNRRGTLLAAGSSDGRCIIWDFETRGIAKELVDPDCTAAITSVSWSKYGHRILVSAADKSLTLWDVFNALRISRTLLQHTPLLARLHPTTPSLCIACPISSAPLIVHLDDDPTPATNTTHVLPISVAPCNNNKLSDAPSTAFTPTAACFNKFGDLVYLGSPKGEILIIDHTSLEVRALVPVPGAAVIKSFVFSRNGHYLLTNSNDRTIRIYENLLPVKHGLCVLDGIAKNVVQELNGVDKLKAVGSKCLSLFREFQDSITKIHWKAPCFSGDGEWVVGGSASKGEHKIYIWDRVGHLIKILEGPKEALIDLAWHPVHPIVVSVSLTGLVYIWAKDYTENWSAFAPDFKELEENEEYVEREDEFDLVPDTEKVKESDINEDDEVDIMTMEEESAFSDSDMSQEELCFLPAFPCPDVSEEEEKYIESSLKLLDSNNSDSPLSEEGGQDKQAIDHAAASPAEEDMEGTRLRRKRKPSEKGMELQAEKVRKPSTVKPSAIKSSKLKNKCVADQDASVSLLVDDLSEEYN